MTGSVRERSGNEASLRLVAGLDVSLHAVPPARTARVSSGPPARTRTWRSSRPWGGAAGCASPPRASLAGPRRLRVHGEAERLSPPRAARTSRRSCARTPARSRPPSRGETFATWSRREDIRGMVHCHTTYSDGTEHDRGDGARGGGARDGYITITDHSPTASYAGGLDLDRLERQWDEIERVQETGRASGSCAAPSRTSSPTARSTTPTRSSSSSTS